MSLHAGGHTMSLDSEVGPSLALLTYYELLGFSAHVVESTLPHFERSLFVF